MNVLSIENISKSYGEKVLFDRISFGIDENEKVGLIGINGTGKSTFLKVLVGIETPDQGKVVTGNNVRIEYLSQNPPFEDQATILEQIFDSNTPIMKLLKEYEYTLEKVAKSPTDEQLQTKLLQLNQKMDAMDAWQIESEAKTVLTKLGIYDFDAKMDTLSGGQRKRVALAGALIRPADLLILDEPTNHIDNETISWLEEYLNRRKGALIMITHDRYFLDRITNRIIELEQGKLYQYTGNYSIYLEKKAEREEQLQIAAKKQHNLFKRELAWLRKGVQGRGTKQKARIDRFEQLKEDKINIASEQIDISVGSTRLGKKIIELENISKNMGGKQLIDDFSYIVLRNDRVGIIGPNGTGKSTLLNIIAGRVKQDLGTVEIGETVKLGYYSQENREMDHTLRVIEYIKEEAEYMYTADGTRISASQMLERFLFSPDMQWTPIGKLSGGEKRRLYLLRILMSAPNVLLLDEPTNDLDIQTLSILEEYLEEFTGPVIVVSHDRYFLDKTAEKVFSFEGNGIITQYPGNYSDYHESYKRKMVEVEKQKEPQKKESKNDVPNKKGPKLKFTYKEQREYEQIDENIEEVENKLAEVAEKISSAGSDYVMLQDLTKEQKQLEEQLELLMERWTYLNELAEQIEQNRSK